MGSLSFTLAELSRHADVVLAGDKDFTVSKFSSLENADPKSLCYYQHHNYKNALDSTKAGCVILRAEDQHLFKGNKLLSDNPYYIYAQLSQLFLKPAFSISEGIHPTAIIGEGCKISEGVNIAPYVVIGNDVSIHKGVVIGTGTTIGNDCIIGENTCIFPQVSIYTSSVIGKHCQIHSQAVIGSDGFGHVPMPDYVPESNEGKYKWQKIHQLGSVKIGDYVEVGAGTTIDRGALDVTLIGSGVKLDNQIHIAHNVSIGEDTAIAAATAIAGSTKIGKRCTIAGAVGIVGHIEIADDVHITAMTLVTKSITKAGSYSSGTPMNKTTIWRKNAAKFNRLFKQKT